jgi:hypothetical protein
MEDAFFYDPLSLDNSMFVQAGIEIEKEKHSRVDIKDQVNDP